MIPHSRLQALLRKEYNRSCYPVPEMRVRSDKKASQIKKSLAIASALVLALSSVVKLLKDNSSEKHEAIVSANERYTTYLTESNTSMQLILKQIRDTNEKLQNLTAIPVQKRDYSQIANEYNQSSEQLRADLNRNFDEASKLIDALPSEYRALRERSGIFAAAHTGQSRGTHEISQWRR